MVLDTQPTPPEGPAPRPMGQSQDDSRPIASLRPQPTSLQGAVPTGPPPQPAAGDANTSQAPLQPTNNPTHRQDLYLLQELFPPGKTHEILHQSQPLLVTQAQTLVLQVLEEFRVKVDNLAALGQLTTMKQNPLHASDVDIMATTSNTVKKVNCTHCKSQKHASVCCTFIPKASLTSHGKTSKASETSYFF